MVLNYKARSRKLGAAVLVVAVAAMLMATGLPGKLEQAHAAYVDPTDYTIGFHTPAKITKLIYPTMGNPAIVKQDTTLTVEWDPREGFVTEGSFYPVCTAFQASVTSTNGGNGAITRSLPANGVQGYSTQWPTLVPTLDDRDRPPSKKIYLVTVTIPNTLPADLYDLTVSCIIEGTRYDDVQTNSLDVVQQFKDKLNFVQLTDIHVFGPECNYISSNQKERTARTTTWNPINGYGATFYHKAIQQINRIHPDFVIFTGDYDFGQKYLHQDRGAGWGDSTEYEYEQSWFYQETQKLEVPVYIVMGNHDGYNYSFDHGGPWQQDWFGNWTHLYGPLYHTFNYGPDYKFFAINTMGWTSPQRTLENYFGIILQPNKYLGQAGSKGDLYEDGLDWNRTGARTIDIPTFSGQLGWLRDQLAASSSQDAKARIMAMHHDPWKDNGSGSMWKSGADPITGDVLNMGNGEGRLSLMRLAKDYKVQLMIHGHDHSDCISTDDTNAAQLDWTAGGGQVISANTTSTSFQADGDSPEYPGYRRVWLEDGNVLQAPAGAESLNYVEPYHSWPFYAGTNVGSNTNLHNLSAPALQQSWSATPGPTTEDVTCSLTSVYNKPLTDAYLEFPMKYLSGGYYYTVSNGTFGETFDVSGSVRMNQVFTNMEGPQSNKLVRVQKSASRDTTTPTGSVSINDGAASTDIADVTLTLEAVDTESGVGEMMVSNDSGFTGAEWQRFQTSIPWKLTGGSGTKTVYVKYRDRAMPPHEVTRTDTIEFSAPPTDARITSVNPNNSNRGTSLTVDIYGANTNFVNGTSRATFSFPGGSPLPFDVWSTTVHSATWATASIHIPSTVSMGAWDVGMEHGELTMPKVGGFTVNGPYISAVDPVQGAVGTTLNVAITGVGTTFVAGTSRAEFWRGGSNVPGLTVNSTTRISDTLCRANITIANGCDTGPVDVTVRNWDDYAIRLVGGFEIVKRRVRSVTPQSGVLGQTLDVAILGSQTHFDGANPVATFGAGITVHSVTVTDALHASANITISPSATAGTRNVNLTTTGETPAPLIAGFTVEYPDPTVVYIAPNEAPNSGSIHISVLDGTGLRSGATVKLKLGTEADIVATNVVVAGDRNSLSCDFNVNGKRGGAWDVVVTNPDLKSAMLPGGFTINANPTKTGPTPIWYLAEGTSDYGFDTYITIENPNTRAVTAMVTYMTKAGPRTRAAITLPAMSQTVVNPRNDIEATDFSTKVECKEGKSIAVDRRMTWQGPGAPSQEGHSSVGVTSPARTWYLAEGSSKWGFESWLLIQNPGTTVAHCTVTYMIEGAGPVSVPHDIPAGSRASFNMETEPGVGACDASIKVVSKDVPVIPERAMYRNNRREGHDSIGTTTPARDYYLAEGTTDWGFTTYVLVQNPNTTPTTVNITYMTPKGPVPQDPFTMDPNSRKTINVNNLPGMSKTDCSIHVAGTAPIIAERAMYWGAGTPLGEACHDSIGMASPHSAFFLPDGETGNGMETWTLVQNPNKTNVTVEICYLTPDGKGIVKFNDIINANSRKSYNMADKIPAGRAAVMVTSRTSNARIMVERAMYWNARGAGTDTIGGYADL